MKANKYFPGTEYESSFWKKELLVAGVDEAGRGALAGPVVSAAIILPIHSVNDLQCRDSKLMSATERERVFEILHERALAIGIGIISHDEIDRVNIRVATRLAMSKALEQLQPLPRHALIDGNYFEHATLPFSTIVKGDYHCYSIAAASVIAKVTRDRIMNELEGELGSLYYFAKNKGYGTATHRAALQKLGPSSSHRMTFLKRILNQDELPFQEHTRDQSDRRD